MMGRKKDKIKEKLILVVCVSEYECWSISLLKIGNICGKQVFN